MAAAANSKAAREHPHNDEDGVRTSLHREGVDEARGQALGREEALPGLAAALNGGPIRECTALRWGFLSIHVELSRVRKRDPEN